MLTPTIDDLRPGQPPGIRISFGALSIRSKPRPQPMGSLVFDRSPHFRRGPEYARTGSVAAVFEIRVVPRIRSGTPAAKADIQTDLGRAGPPPGHRGRPGGPNFDRKP